MCGPSVVTWDSVTLLNVFIVAAAVLVSGGCRLIPRYFLEIRGVVSTAVHASSECVSR